MNSLRVSFLIMLTSFFLAVMAIPSLATNDQGPGCPPLDQVQEQIQKVLREKVTVEKITPAPLPGMCQVQASMKGRKRILYTDAEGKYFLFGQLVDAASGRNYTDEVMQELMRLTADEMKRLEPLVAFSAGRGDKVIYYVTDPECPYCKEGEETLKKLTDAGEIMVKFLLFPLDIHKGAREQCISILCDGKGLEGFDSGYKSENQCPEGAKKIDDTIAFMLSKGIGGTPAYILPDGRYLIGTMQEETLRERLGLPQSPDADKKNPDTAGVTQP